MRQPTSAPRLEMVDIPGGSFWMGTARDDLRGYAEERPRHRVDVQPFVMAKYVVTQRLYRRVIGAHGGRPRGDNLPVNNVTWGEAVVFCNRLSDLERLPRAYAIEGATVTWVEGAEGYRLPTEAEWEYAARAGTETAYSFGDHRARLGEFAWYSENARSVKPVGQKRPNPWGLYDMHGNVWEWCWDEFAEYPGVPAMRQDSSRGEHVLRGGSFGYAPGDMRSARRHGDSPKGRDDDIGFRCVRGPRR